MLKDYPSQEAAGRHGYVVVRAMDTMNLHPEDGPGPKVDHANYVIIRDCPLCNKESRVIVPAQGLWNWEHGEFVQRAFPELSAGEREQVMTGMHEDCFDDAFKDEED